MTGTIHCIERPRSIGGKRRVKFAVLPEGKRDGVQWFTLFNPSDIHALGVAGKGGRVHVTHAKWGGGVRRIGFFGNPETRREAIERKYGSVSAYDRENRRTEKVREGITGLGHAVDNEIRGKEEMATYAAYSKLRQILETRALTQEEAKEFLEFFRASLRINDKTKMERDRWKKMYEVLEERKKREY